MTRYPVALTIAGSDPSGGAGIQADLKTFSVIGVYGAAAISSITCQNTLGVDACHSLSPSVVREQIYSVLNDLNVTHIKVGMAGSSDVANAIADALDKFPGEVVYDPVRVSSSGADLMTGTNVDDSWKRLISKATILTPNRNELDLLSSNTCKTEINVIKACEEVFDSFPRLRCILAKGGHFHTGSQVTDLMCSRSPVKGKKSNPIAATRSVHPRIETTNLHGTGCTFSSAFTAYHLLKGNDKEAFTMASDFMYRIIKLSAGIKIGSGAGPLIHHQCRNS